MGSKKVIFLAGGIVGILAVILVFFGNPANMGFCIACFLRDISGALGLHQAGVVQYVRPEIIGLVLGAFLLALFKKEFVPRGGSDPFLRFLLGAIMMVSALVFLGCPLRMILRLAGGDLNAVPGFIGFVAGIAIGIFFLNRGFSLKRNYRLSTAEGLAFPIVTVALLLAVLVIPAYFMFSESGPGSMHAPLAIALAAGLIVGGIAQRTRMCTMGGIRDVILFRDFHLFMGFIGIFVFALIGNLITGKFSLGFIDQPVAHTEVLWNFLSMLGVGLAAALLGGCPFRQLILAAEGNTDSVMAVMGMIVGAAFAHNMKFASSAAGTTAGGRVALIIGILFMLGLAAYNAGMIFSKKNEHTQSIASTTQAEGEI